VAERVILHVGPPKAGSTFLQTLLWNNKSRLAKSGVLIPGRRQFDLNLVAKAVREGPLDIEAAGPAHRVMHRIVNQIRDWPGTAVLSNEWFSLTPRSSAERFLEALAPAQVHVVATARAFVEQVPAAWQETLKLGQATSLPAFVAGLDRDGERWSWGNLDPSALLARWHGLVPAEQVHVVTVPARGSDPRLLWRRFGALGGVDPDAYDASKARPNASLPVEGARLLQLLGAQLRAALDEGSDDGAPVHRWIRDFIGNELLAESGRSRIALGPAELALVRRRTETAAEKLVEGGFDIVGDMAEFTHTRLPENARAPDQVSAEELLAVAAPLVSALLERVRLEYDRAESAEAKLAQSTNGRTFARSTPQAPTGSRTSWWRPGANWVR
jgi:hypothetical protein